MGHKSDQKPFGAPETEDGLLQELRHALDACTLCLTELDHISQSGASHSLKSHGPLKGAESIDTGTRLGDFEIRETVGHGGMGVVYRARQVSLDRDVALKVLTTRDHRRSTSKKRFRLEAQAVARMRHPNVVPVFAHGEEGEHTFFAMEFVEGISLDGVIRGHREWLSSTFDAGSITRSSNPLQTHAHQPAIDGCLPEGQDQPTKSVEVSWDRTEDDFRHLAGLLAGAAEGLAHAHELGVIHRDIKPHNLLLGTDGRVRLTDFGLAHLADQSDITLSGEIMGTPAYLAPEQIRGDRASVEVRTDIYSMGVTLYELLTWKLPFEGHSREQVLHQICSVEPIPPRRIDKRIPRDLETICLRAMEKLARNRFDSAKELACELRRFADGEPIHSKPIHRIQRGFRWARRHRVASLCMVSVTIAVMLAAILVGVVNAQRYAEAERELEDAYEELVYLDYRAPQRVLPTIEWAAERGADPLKVQLALALASMGGGDEDDARLHLDALLADEPENVTALYMLAWAAWRANDRTYSRSVFARAEALGGPISAEDWFLRGLAAHFDLPDIAIESYLQAVAQRSAAHRFYPQAVLHLARAYNQRLYVTRELETFEAAKSTLEQLIEHQNYGAYPYYLLSIAHRLAGEIHQSLDTAGGRLVADEHFSTALSWALQGQVVDPDDDRPITAEAECLERLDRYPEAVDARSRALAIAEHEIGRCESYHYRWRLNYWLGNLDSAMADIEAHQECMPEDVPYRYILPALLDAERGNIQAAVDALWSIPNERPDDIRAWLWAATGLRLLGRPDEALQFLQARADRTTALFLWETPGEAEWLQSLFLWSSGDIRTDDHEIHALLDVEPSRSRQAEFHFHTGIRALSEGNRQTAIEHLEASRRAFDGELGFTFYATALVRQLESSTEWPAWMTGPSLSEFE